MKFILEINISDEHIIDDPMPKILEPAVKCLADVFGRQGTHRQLIDLVKENCVGKPDDLYLGESGLEGVERPILRMRLSEEPFDTTHSAADNPDAYLSTENSPHRQEHRDETRN